MTNYKVSVIIPTYNAQDTIRRAVDSVINQTIGFSNIELIIYDDKSTDNTREILNEYAEKHDNIVLVLADENSGYPGKGRNEGIRIASSDYIMFMDDDDEYLPDMCETLYNEIVEENADIVSSNYLNIDEISKEVAYNNWRGGICKNNKIIFLNNDIYKFNDVLVWSKIFRKSIIVQNKVKFPENKLSEDVYFMFILLAYANKIVYLKDYVGYLRYVQGDSLSNSLTYDKSNEIIDVSYEIYYFYKSNKTDVNISSLLACNIQFCLMNIYKTDMLENKKEVRDLLNRIYNLEKEIDFDDSYMDISIIRASNKLLMKKQFRLVTVYFEIMKKIFKSQLLRKFYRIVSG